MRTFAPSAMSVPQKPLFRCDNQCSEKTLSYWQLAYLVIFEGEESYTTNICHMCFSNSLKAKGEKPLTNVQCILVVEKKRLTVEEPHVREKWEYFLQVRNRAKSWLKKKSRQEYKVSGSWNRQPENTWRR